MFVNRRTNHLAESVLLVERHIQPDVGPGKNVCQVTVARVGAKGVRQEWRSRDFDGRGGGEDRSIGLLDPHVDPSAFGEARGVSDDAEPGAGSHARRCRIDRGVAKTCCRRGLSCSWWVETRTFGREWILTSGTYRGYYSYIRSIS